MYIMYNFININKISKVDVPSLAIFSFWVISPDLGNDS